MPLYEFVCQKCGSRMEVSISVADRDSAAPLCCKEGCDAIPMERVVSQTSFVLKGSGWAKDGYK